MKIPHTRRMFLAAALLACAPLGVSAQQGEVVKLAWLDPLSGMMANVGELSLNAYQITAAAFNQKSLSGVQFELVPFDSKLSPPESTAVVYSAIDQGIRYIVHGTGSSVALAVLEAVSRHNARNPGREVLYFNHGAIDPELTNSKCSYWHFRTDADLTMKAAALTGYLKTRADVKKVFQFNQNYAFGQQLSRLGRDMLAQARPDIEIVGDDLIPLAQVRDFAPYVAKIKASGADTLITGNWGTDLNLLLKAVQDAGMSQLKIFAYYAYISGSPTAIAARPDMQVYAVNGMHYHLPGPMQALSRTFKQKTGGDLVQASIYHTFAALDAAFAKAGSTDPLKVAAVLEDLRFDSVSDVVHMRGTDHQLQQGLYVLQWQKAGGEYPNDVENTGYTFVPVHYITAEQASTPTTCQMRRP